MKSIKIIISIIIFALYAGYIYTLAMNDSAIFNANYISSSANGYVWLALIFVWMLAVILYISHILTKYPKIIVSIIWILIVLLAKYILLDTWTQGIYISDVTALIWVVICVLTRFWVLITDPVYAKWEYSKKVEIIEV